MRRAIAALCKHIPLPLRNHSQVSLLVMGLAMLSASLTVVVAWGQPGVSPPNRGGQPVNRPGIPQNSVSGPGGQTGAAQNAQSEQSADPPLPKTLPSTFNPPGVPPEVMTLNKELLEPKDHAEFKQLVRDYNRALRNGTLDNASRTLIQQGIRYRVHLLSDRDQREQLYDVRKDLMRDLQMAAGLQNNPQLARQFREFFLGEVIARCEELLDNNFYVRLNAVLILTQLNMTEGNVARGVTPEAYTPAAEPLLKVVNDPDQLDAIKIVAVKGLQRICREGQPRPNSSLRLEIGQSLVNQIESKETHFWYQVRLAETLSTVEIFLDGSRKPFIVQKLAEVLVDDERHWLVRTEAAKSLGRVEMDGSINLTLLAFHMATLSRQMAEAYNANPRAFYWKDAFFRLYLAFRPMNSQERQGEVGLLVRTEKAAFSSHRRTVENAYGEILPLVQHALKADQPIPKTRIDRLSDWLQENQPQDVRLAPNLEPITTKQIADTPASAG